jgi:hypothetical protein
MGTEPSSEVAPERAALFFALKVPEQVHEELRATPLVHVAGATILARGLSDSLARKILPSDESGHTDAACAHPGCPGTHFGLTLKTCDVLVLPSGAFQLACYY